MRAKEREKFELKFLIKFCWVWERDTGTGTAKHGIRSAELETVLFDPINMCLKFGRKSLKKNIF